MKHTEPAATVHRLFAETAAAWPRGGFEQRPDQVHFACRAARQALAGSAVTSGIALGLGCGEGKQEGFAVAMRATWELWGRQHGAARPKLLFVTATADLVGQMQRSVPLRPLRQELTIVGPGWKNHQGEAPGIYLLDFHSFLNLSLDAKRGVPVALLEGVDHLFLDEVHALLAMPPFITCHNSVDSLAPWQSDPYERRRIDAEIGLLETLVAWVGARRAEDAALVAPGDQRYRYVFDAEGRRADEVSALRARLSQDLNHSLALRRLDAQSAEGFRALLDTAAHAVGLQPGRDYYLHTAGSGEVTGYSVAERRTGKPMEGTIFSDPRLATCIALKHVAPAPVRGAVETHFVLSAWLHRAQARIAPAEALSRFGARRVTAASATLRGIARRLQQLDLVPVPLQSETVLVADDPAATTALAHGDPVPALSHWLQSAADLPEQLAVTSRDAALLTRLGEALSPTFAVTTVLHEANNPDAEAFARRLRRAKAEIRRNPHRRRLLLVQGLGEGSNLFALTPRGDYRAAVICLDLLPIDQLTQTRFRIGTRGRAPGWFRQQAGLHPAFDDALTREERRELAASGDPAPLLREVQERMLVEMDREDVALDVSRLQGVAKEDAAGWGLGSRREFLRLSGAWAAGAVLAGWGWGCLRQGRQKLNLKGIRRGLSIAGMKC